MAGSHDEFFRVSFGRPGRLGELLRLYLPPQLAQSLDLTDVEIIKDSFVDEELKKHQSDLLCRVRFKDGSGIYIYILIEHKSRPAWWVALQLLRYMVRIWERVPKKARGRLPVVFPLVFYHGRQRWNVPLSFIALFEPAAVELIRRYLPDFEYLLLDFSARGKTEIKGENPLQAAITSLRGVFEDRVVDWLARAIELVRDDPDSLEWLTTILIYFAEARQLSHAEIREALRRTVRDPQKRKEVEMSYVEQLREQGREQGIVQGIEQGIEQGALKVLLRALSRRFGPPGVKLQKQLGALSLPQMEQLSEAMFEFQSRRDLTNWLHQQEELNLATKNQGQK